MRRISGLLAVGLVACTASPPLREVAVTGSDYAFEGPDSLASGLVAFSFENRGQVPHEVKVIALKPGKTLADTSDPHFALGMVREIKVY